MASHRGKGKLLIGIIGLVNSPGVIFGVLLAMVVEYQQKIGKQKGEVRLSWALSALIPKAELRHQL